MTIYIDAECRCHATTDGTMRAFNLEFFDGKCPEYIEGFRHIPQGETWTRDDGVVFTEGMTAPWRLSTDLEGIQRQYERQLIAEYSQALEIVGVTV